MERTKATLSRPTTVQRCNSQRLSVIVQADTVFRKRLIGYFSWGSTTRGERPGSCLYQRPAPLCSREIRALGARRTAQDARRARLGEETSGRRAEEASGRRAVPAGAAYALPAKLTISLLRLFSANQRFFRSR